MNEVKNPPVIYEENQGTIILAKNRKFSICAKHIYIRHHFLRDMVEDQDIDTQYIWSGDNHADIMTKNNSESDFTWHMKSIIEGEL